MKILIRIILIVINTCYLNNLFSQPLTFSPRGIGGGGALFFPTINPANDDEFYVSCDMSEMFHSTDFGDTYTQIPFNKLTTAGHSTYEFTSDASIAYSVYNDGNNDLPSKTTDGGNTWNVIQSYDLNNYGDVYKLKSNYNNPQQLIINSYADILISNDGGLNFNLIKHATNSGAGIIVGGIQFSGNNIYIGTNEGILFSTNGGLNFNTISTSGLPSNQVIWSFAAGSDGTHSRFICITADAADVYNGVNPWEYYNFAKGVYMMNDADGVWDSSSGAINFSNDFIMYAGMAENNINDIYLAGNDNALGAPLVYKSADGGLSWNKKFNTNNNQNIQTGWEGYQGDKNWGWSENCFGISVAPHNSNKVLFSTFSNVEVSRDGGDNWKQAYVNNSSQHSSSAPTPKNQLYQSIGLENTTCWQIHWHGANKMMSAFSDIGAIESPDAGSSWGYTYSGFAVNSVYRIAEANGNIYAGCSNIHDMYQSTRLTDALLDANDGNGKIVYSTDDGATFATLHVFNHPVFWLAVDPTDANTMYASVIHFGGTQGAQQGGIYVTHDLNNGNNSSWNKLPDPPRTEGHPASINVLRNGNVVCTFSGRRNSAGAFTASSGVFVYDPSANSWSDNSDANMHYWTKDLVVDTRDTTEQTWYGCVFSGWGAPPNDLGGLYKTSDAGLTWARLTSATDFHSVTSITFNPLNTEQAFMTTETQGLFVSNDMSAAIPGWSLVESYPFRQPERVFFNPYNQNEMWVSSFGNGMKMGSNLPLTTDHAINRRSINIFPNPANNELTILLNDVDERNDLKIFNSTGQLISNLKIDKNICTINISSFNPGIYSLVYKEQNFRLVKE